MLTIIGSPIPEFPQERFVQIYNSITSKISFLVTGRDSEPSEKLGGIIALDQLIDFDGGIDAAQKTTRFAGHLQHAIKGNDNAVTIEATRVLGRLTQPGRALTAELVESELRSALEMLQNDKPDNRRFAASLIIRELAKNSPTLLYGFVPQIFDLIWAAIRDSRVLVRETASEALGFCLAIVQERESRLQWFPRIYGEVIHGMKSTSVEVVHGSLLVIKQLLVHCGMFMESHYTEICDHILRLKDHRDGRVRNQVVNTIPSLAKYSPLDFVRLYLKPFLVHLVSQLKKDKERGPAFVAVGNVAKAIGNPICPYLDTVIAVARETLATKSYVFTDTLRSYANTYKQITSLSQ